MLLRRWIWGAIPGSLAVAFITFRLFKAALLSVGVGLLAVSLLYVASERPELLFRIAALGAIGLALVWI